MEHIFHISNYEKVSDELNQIISVESSIIRDLIGIKHNTISTNNLTAHLIGEKLSQNISVYFRRDCKSVELMPYDLIIGAEVEDIETIKNQALVEAKYYVTHHQSLITGLMMFDFICINNELCDKGYFITDYNREEKYIEILENEDEDLISKLEIYLNAKDQIQRASFLENEYQKYYKDIKQSDEITKVLEIKEKFLTRLQNVSK